MSKHRVSNLKLREISSVDRPAQVGAVSVLIKRREDPTKALAKATFSEALEANRMSQKVNRAFYDGFDGLWERNDAFKEALTDELASGGDGAVASADYKTSVNDLVDRAVASAREADTDGTDDLNKAFTKAATDWLADQETDMTIKTKADLQAAIEKAQAAGDKVTVGDVQAIHKAAAELKEEGLLPATGVLAKAAPSVDAEEFAKMKKVSELTPVEKAAYDKLTDPAAKLAFLNKSATERATDIEKAGGDDPVVYTTLDGIDIRKSAGDTVLALAKRNDVLAKDLAKSQAASEDVTLEKRAKDDLGNIGGELIGKKALLKALDGISDAATRDQALSVLKSANELAKGAFKKSGSTAGNDLPTQTVDGQELSEAEAKLDEMAKAHAKDNKVTFEKAYSEVIQTAEGSELYKRFVAGE